MRLPISFTKKCAWRAVQAASLSTSLTGVGVAIALMAPWWLTPLGWLVGGVGLFGLMVLCHDAGHGTLFEKVWLNNAAGHLLSLPIAQPFVPMRLLHAKHHLHLNHVERDPTWKPWSREKYASKPVCVRWLYRAVRQELWWLGTVLNLVVFHFDLRAIPASKRRAAVVSMAASVTFTLGMTTTFYTLGGASAVLSGLLAPWIVFNVIFSTVTFLQHTNTFGPAIAWHAGDKAADPLASTVHLKLPWLVATLFHNINYHVPHHVNPNLPFYLLPEAHAWLKEQGVTPLEAPLNARTVLAMIRQNHLFDLPAGRFVTFQEGLS